MNEREPHVHKMLTYAGVRWGEVQTYCMLDTDCPECVQRDAELAAPFMTEKPFDCPLDPGSGRCAMATLEEEKVDALESKLHEYEMIITGLTDIIEGRVKSLSQVRRIHTQRLVKEATGGKVQMKDNKGNVIGEQG